MLRLACEFHTTSVPGETGKRRDELPHFGALSPYLQNG